MSKAQCLSFPFALPYSSSLLRLSYLLGSPLSQKNKLTCLRRKGSKPYFATGVSHVLRRFDRWDVFEYAITHAYDGDDRSRDHADSTCLQ